MSVSVITTPVDAPHATPTHVSSWLPATMRKNHKTQAVVNRPQSVEMCCITQSQLQVSDLSLPFLPGVATTKPTRTSDLLSGPDNVSQNRHREETLSETRNSKLTLYRHSTPAAPQSPEAQMSEVMLFVHHVSARDSCYQVSSSPQTPTCRKSTRPQEESQATEMSHITGVSF